MPTTIPSAMRETHPKRAEKWKMNRMHIPHVADGPSSYSSAHMYETANVRSSHQVYFRAREWGNRTCIRDSSGKTSNSDLTKPNAQDSSDYESEAV